MGCLKRKDKRVYANQVVRKKLANDFSLWMFKNNIEKENLVGL